MREIKSRAVFHAPILSRRPFTRALCLVVAALVLFSSSGGMLQSLVFAQSNPALGSHDLTVTNKLNNPAEFNDIFWEPNDPNVLLTDRFMTYYGGLRFNYYGNNKPQLTIGVYDYDGSSLGTATLSESADSALLRPWQTQSETISSMAISGVNNTDFYYRFSGITLDIYYAPAGVQPEGTGWERSLFDTGLGLPEELCFKYTAEFWFDMSSLDITYSGENRPPVQVALFGEDGGRITTLGLSEGASAASYSASSFGGRLISALTVAGGNNRAFYYKFSSVSGRNTLDVLYAPANEQTGGMPEIGDEWTPALGNLEIGEPYALTHVPYAVFGENGSYSFDLGCGFSHSMGYADYLNRDGLKKLFSDLPAGVNYRITQLRKNAEGIDLGRTWAVTPESGVIRGKLGSSDVNVEFVNEYDEVTEQLVTVTNVANGAEPDEEFIYKIKTQETVDYDVGELPSVGNLYWRPYYALKHIDMNGFFGSHYEPIDLSRSCSVTVLGYDGHYGQVPNVQVNLYMIAAYDDDGRLRLTNNFSDFRPDIPLSMQIREYWLEPIAAGTTDSNGSITFEGLSPGLYIAMPDESITFHGGNLFRFSELVFSLPGAGANGVLDYETRVYLGCEGYPLEHLQPLKRTLKLTFNDFGLEEFRPDGLEICLTSGGSPELIYRLTAHEGCNREQYGNVSLTEYMLDDHTWIIELTGLDPYSEWEWTFREMPEGYYGSWLTNYADWRTRITLTPSFNEQFEPVEDTLIEYPVTGTSLPYTHTYINSFYCDSGNYYGGDWNHQSRFSQADDDPDALCFSLKAGESLVFRMDTGFVYEISQYTKDGWKIMSPYGGKAEGRIEHEDVELVFVNLKDGYENEVTVKKYWENDTPEDRPEDLSATLEASVTRNVKYSYEPVTRTLNVYMPGMEKSGRELLIYVSAYAEWEIYDPLLIPDSESSVDTYRLLVYENYSQSDTELTGYGIDAGNDVFIMVLDEYGNAIDPNNGGPDFMAHLSPSFANGVLSVTFNDAWAAYLNGSYMDDSVIPGDSRFYVGFKLIEATDVGDTVWTNCGEPPFTGNLEHAGIELTAYNAYSGIVELTEAEYSFTEAYTTSAGGWDKTHDADGYWEYTFIVPADAEITGLTETEPEGYTLKSVDLNALELTNERSADGLTVTKRVEGNAGETNRKFDFDITFRTEWNPDVVEQPTAEPTYEIPEYVYDTSGTGTTGPDTYHGDERNNYYDGKSNNDIIYGYAGNDYLIGGGGIDEIHGGDDADILEGGIGKDKLYGDGGDDILRGGQGIDELHGGDGNDILVDTTSDSFYPGPGDDLIYCGTSSSISIAAGEGNDTICGGGRGTLDVTTGGIGTSDLTFAKRGSHLVIGFKNNTGSITLWNYFAMPQSERLDALKLASTGDTVHTIASLLPDPIPLILPEIPQGVTGGQGGSSTYSFSLAHGESITFTNLPVGVAYTVSEHDYSGDGYTTSCNGIDDTSACTGIFVGSTEIDFVNTKSMPIPTGIGFDASPWLAALGFALTVCAWGAVKTVQDARARRREL